MIRHGAWAGPAEEAVESLLSFEFGNTSPNRRWSLTPAVYDCLQEPQRLDYLSVHIRNQAMVCASTHQNGLN